MPKPHLSHLLKDIESRGLKGTKCRWHLGQALSSQMMTKTHIGRAVKKKAVVIKSFGTRGRIVPAIGSHASIDRKARSRRLRIVRRPRAILSDSEATARGADARRGGPHFKPSAANMQPITTPGSMISRGPTRAPTMFANPNTVQTMPTQRGHVFSQVMRIVRNARAQLNNITVEAVHDRR
jgi:hypothetical protein